MPVTVRMAQAADLEVVLRSRDLFDHPPRPDWTKEVLSDPRHHLVIGLAGDDMIGFLSGVHFLHPDKPPQMWINEIGVASAHQRQGVGGQMIAEIETMARTLSCTEIWVLADPTEEALGFYTALGWAREGSHIALFSKELS